MRKFLLVLPLLFLVSCGGDGDVFTPDHKDQIDDNTDRIELLEASDAAQNLRLDSLEDRMTDAEDDIAANAQAAIDLVDALDAELSQDIVDLRDHLHRHVRDLERADRQTRRDLSRQITSLSRHLHGHIRDLEDADDDLQDDIDDLERDLNRFESRQRFFNLITTGAIAATNFRIYLLQQNIQSQLNALDARITVNAGAISSINGELDALDTLVADLQTQIDDVGDNVTRVVYPCGEGSSQEVLLQTQDGLVAYFQSSSNKTLNFSGSITIPDYNIPAHLDKYCEDTNFFNGECNQYSYRSVGAETIPGGTYSVGDSVTIKTIDKAYLDVLGQGSYQTTDGFSCNFSIDSNGQLVN